MKSIPGIVSLLGINMNFDQDVTGSQASEKKNNRYNYFFSHDGTTIWLPGRYKDYSYFHIDRPQPKNTPKILARNITLSL